MSWKDVSVMSPPTVLKGGFSRRGAKLAETRQMPFFPDSAQDML